MKKPEKKRRVDCWEASLTPEQKEVIFDKMTRRFAPADILEFIAAEFRIAAPSRAALYEFRKRWEPVHEKMLATELISSNQSCERTMEKIGVPMDDVILNKAKLAAAAAATRGDTASSQMWLSIIEDIATRRHDTEKLALDRARIERLLAAEKERDALKLKVVDLEKQLADAKAKLLAMPDNKKLTADEKEERIKEIFGIS